MGLYYNIALFFSFETLFEDSAEITCIAKIIGLKEEKTYVDKYNLKIISCTQIPKSKNKKIVAHIEKGKEYRAGDIVYFKGVIKRGEESRNFYGFNHRNYLKQNKIYGIIDVEESRYIKTDQSFDYILGIIQNSLNNKIKILYNAKYRGIVNKILFGMNGNIDEEIKSNFRDAGISHVLAISGLHISYISIMLNFILENIIYDLKIRNRLICLLLILFLVITGASPSCVRACIMNMLNLISQNTYRKSNIYKSIEFSFGIILFCNIFVIYNIGMWLSFLGTLGIVLFYPMLSMVLKRKRNTFIYKILDMILVSVSAQIFIWPIVLYCFNTISFTFFVSNIFISILIGPIIVLGYVSIILSYFIFPIAKIIVVIEEFIIQILFLIADVCSKIPFSKIYIKGTNTWILIAYYIFICFLIYYYLNKKISIYRKIINIKKFFYIKNAETVQEKVKTILHKSVNLFYKILNNIYITVNQKLCFENRLNAKDIIFSSFKASKKFIKKFILYSIILIFGITQVIVIFEKIDFKLYFVDVGQGDCCVIQVEGKNMIIDSGEGNSNSYDYGKNVVFQHLLKLGISKLDYVVFSHMDSDHAGGLMYILQNMKVEEILIGIQPEGAEQLNTLLNIVNEKNIKLTVLESEMKVKISKNCFMDVLWPMKQNLIEENALNNNSMVFKLYYNQYSILFTGDIEEIAEKQIEQKYKERLKCDILKVAHHGSKTSTMQEFLEYAKPEIALIGVGEENKFGHPNKDVINRLHNLRCKSL